MKRIWILLSLVTLATWIFVIDLYAQTRIGISGKVVDHSSNVVRAAKVTVINIASGFEQEMETDSEGRYRFNGLTPGAYRVMVESEGYSSASRVVTVES